MRAKPKFDPSSLLCSTPGCGKAWIGNFGRRYCADHAPARRPDPQGPARRSAPRLAIPLHEAVRPFIEPVERDDTP
jgi:hypothetical protein